MSLEDDFMLSIFICLLLSDYWPIYAVLENVNVLLVTSFYADWGENELPTPHN